MSEKIAPTVNEAISRELKYKIELFEKYKKLLPFWRIFAKIGYSWTINDYKGMLRAHEAFPNKEFNRKFCPEKDSDFVSLMTSISVFDS